MTAFCALSSASGHSASVGGSYVNIFLKLFYTQALCGFDAKRRASSH